MISYAVSMACCGKVMTRELANASYSRFCKRDARWQLCTWNDVSHLQSIGVRESVAF